ncbi:MAG: molybdopterin molybdotransferase MoeA [Cytophagales bacterium]|nr:molybdopterin molybdotransferase MoeA [Cytophagales bacterium]
MISVQNARDIIESNTNPLPTIELPLSGSLFSILSHDMISPIASPPFAQSAMDGYAFEYSDLKIDIPIPISGVVAAGSMDAHHLQKGTAMRIFTGAPMPMGADTVIVQEMCTMEGDHVIFKDREIKQYVNVRPRASQVDKGDMVAAKGTKITPALIGYMASLGIDKLKVFSKPKIGIIVTGDELVQAGSMLKHGQVYESNMAMLSALCSELRLYVSYMCHTPDHLQTIYTSVKEALQTCDILLMTGGVSVGDYDYVAKALEMNDVNTLFHKVAQKPGKPLYMGKYNQKIIFGLPGNPGSVLTCFYEYAVPCIRALSGYKNAFPKKNMVKILNDYSKKQGLTHYIKAYNTLDGAHIVEGQESYKLNGFAQGNSLVEIGANITQISAGDYVPLLMYDNILSI